MRSCEKSHKDVSATKRHFRLSRDQQEKFCEPPSDLKTRTRVTRTRHVACVARVVGGWGSVDWLDPPSERFPPRQPRAGASNPPSQRVPRTSCVGIMATSMSTTASTTARSTRSTRGRSVVHAAAEGQGHVLPQGSPPQRQGDGGAGDDSSPGSC